MRRHIFFTIRCPQDICSTTIDKVRRFHYVQHANIFLEESVQHKGGAPIVTPFQSNDPVISGEAVVIAREEIDELKNNFEKLGLTIIQFNPEELKTLTKYTILTSGSAAIVVFITIFLFVAHDDNWSKIVDGVIAASIASTATFILELIIIWRERNN